MKKAVKPSIQSKRKMTENQNTRNETVYQPLLSAQQEGQFNSAKVKEISLS